MKNMTDIYGMFINGYGSGVDLELFVTHCIISFTGILLNFVVIALVMCSRRLQEVEGVAFVFNLSCANFIFSAQILFIGFSTKDGIALPKQVCNAFAATTTFSCVAASLSRCVVALDRYVYISDPLHYYIRSTESKIALLITCLWIAAGCLSLTPYITNLFLNRDSTDENCLPSPSSLYIICVLVLGVLLPMVYEVFVYTRIFFWAILHIQIMKQESLFTNRLRRQSATDAVRDDKIQLELFKRASYIMLSALLTKKYNESKQRPTVSTEEDIESVSSFKNLALHVRPSNGTKSQSGAGSLTSTAKANKSQSGAGSFSSAVLKSKKSHSVDTPWTNYSKQADTYLECGIRSSSVDKERKHISFESPDTLFIKPRNIVGLEGNIVHEPFNRMNNRVVRKKPKPASLCRRCYKKLPTYMELKAGFILFSILGSAILCWIPILVMTAGHFAGLDRALLIYDHKVANILIYTSFVLDPLVYVVLHHPIRKAVKDQYRSSFRSSFRNSF